MRDVRHLFCPLRPYAGSVCGDRRALPSATAMAPDEQRCAECSEAVRLSTPGVCPVCEREAPQ